VENGALVNTEEEMAVAVDTLLNRKQLLIQNTEKYITMYSFNRIFEEYILLWN